MENQPVSPEQEQFMAPTQDARIENPDLAYDVAHDSVVHGRVEELQTAKQDAENFVSRGGNPITADQAVTEARAAIDKAVAEATPLYEEQK